QRTPRPSWPLSPSSRSNTNGNWRSSLVSHSLTHSYTYIPPTHTHFTHLKWHCPARDTHLTQDPLVSPHTHDTHTLTHTVTHTETHKHTLNTRPSGESWNSNWNCQI